jgi:outer membrane protein TolC
VRGTAQLVRARAAQLGSAKADLLPRFYLGFLANDGRIEIGDVGASGRFTSWGAGLYLPIFEAGRIRARIRASDAQLEAAVAQHEQTVLAALEDVENAYGTRRALDQRSAQLQSAWQTADLGARHAQRLFDEGNGLLQGAIEARLNALQREDELIQAETARALVTVALYKAVGGGWPSP